MNCLSTKTLKKFYHRCKKNAFLLFIVDFHLTRNITLRKIIVFFRKKQTFNYERNKLRSFIKQKIIKLSHFGVSIYCNYVYESYSRKINSFSSDYQPFLLARFDLGMIILNLKYAALWQKIRGNAYIVVLSTKLDFTKKMAGIICPNVPLICYDSWVFRFGCKHAPSGLLDSRLLGKINAILYSERPDAAFLCYHQPTYLHPYKLRGNYHECFDIHQKYLENKSTEYKLAYQKFNKSMFFHPIFWKDFMHLFQKNEPVKISTELKNAFGFLKNELQIPNEFVVLNINTKNYHSHLYNRRSIFSYECFNPLIDHLIEKGFGVVIQGREEQPLLKKRKGLIDYSRSSFCSEEHDLALFSHATFAICPKTGPETFATIFHTPLLGINYVENANILPHVKHRFFFKHVYDPALGRRITWREYVNSPSFFDLGFLSANDDLQFIDMTSEELIEAVDEFLPLLSLPNEKWLNYTERQKTFKDSLDPTHNDLFDCLGVPCDNYLRITT